MSPLIQYRIIDVVRETADANSYVLEPLTTDFHYKAGQFITFLFYQHAEEIRRSYSLNSSPETDRYPSVTIKRVPNGAISRHILKTWKKGMIVEGLTPAGLFSLNETELPEQLYFFAAGSGIIPIFGILKDCLVRYPGIHIRLFFSNKSKRSAIFLKELEELAASNNNLELRLFFSDSQNLEEARLSKSSLSAMLDSNRNARYFICGPHYYMLMVRIALLSAGIDANHIRQEIFEILPPPVRKNERLPPYVKRQIQLKLGERSYLLDVQPSQSILDAALEEGINAPFNCRAGRCSACLAKCERGTVRMHYNEVLTDADLEKGLILTCTAHPVTNDVIIRY